MDDSKLYNDLLKDLPSFVKVQWLPRSLGVKTRPQDERIENRHKKIQEYFYGINNDLQPLTIELKFNSIQIYKVDRYSEISEVKFSPRELEVSIFAFKSYFC